MPRTLAFALCAVAFWAATLSAQPVVRKVEPPHWWVRHTWNPLQILLTGEGLQDATVASLSPALAPRVMRASDDGRYLFLRVTIAPQAQPGDHALRVRTARGTTQVTLPLLAPSPTAGRFQGFSEQDVIYLLMPDRFANGDPANDSPAEFGLPADRRNIDSYHGGDLAGIRQRLPYLKDLGVTGMWMLPTYANSSRLSMPPHGYHAVDFYAVEPRFGTLDEYRTLVDTAHRLGLKVMQDQVINHTGPHHPWVAHPPTPTWFHGLDRQPRLSNDFRIERLADPHAPPASRVPPLEGWFAGILPDLNQEDPLVADYLIQNSLWWIGATGVDGIRMDTYPYVDRPFWERWQTAVHRQYPGYFVVGEITVSEPVTLAYFEGGVRRHGTDTKLPAMLDFPLLSAIRRVFLEGKPLTDLRGVLSQDGIYLHPERLVTFLGNHDMPRFLALAGGDVAKLRLAQTFLLTTRGIPHLYYGDEIAIPQQPRGTAEDYRVDFPGGFPGDAVNAFTAAGRSGDSATIWNELQALLRFRREHPSLRGGRLLHLLADENRYAYLRAKDDECVVVLLNRGGQADVRLDLSGTVASAGLAFQPMATGAPALRMATDGSLTLPSAGPVSIYWATGCRTR